MSLAYFIHCARVDVTSIDFVATIKLKVINTVHEICHRKHVFVVLTYEKPMKPIDDY